MEQDIDSFRYCSFFTLLIFNYRYHIISPGSKGWSIGYSTINNLIFQESYEDIST